MKVFVNEEAKEWCGKGTGWVALDTGMRTEDALDDGGIQDREGDCAGGKV